jgi:hypothetical protein
MWGKVKLNKADIKFSLYVREKANWKCDFCHKDYSQNHRGLQVSHYWSRRHESTRYDEENCNAFCIYHHHYLGHGEGRDEYRAFKIKELGKSGFDLLDYRAHQYCKKDRKMQYLKWKLAYEKLIQKSIDKYYK